MKRWHRVEWDDGGLWAHVAYMFAIQDQIRRRLSGFHIIRIVPVEPNEVVKGMIVEIPSTY